MKQPMQKYLYAGTMDEMQKLLTEANEQGWTANQPMSTSWMPDINHNTQQILHYHPTYTQIVDRFPIGGQS